MLWPHIIILPHLEVSMCNLVRECLLWLQQTHVHSCLSLIHTNYLFKHHQEARPTAAPSATVTSSSTHMPVQRSSSPSLRGIPPSHQNTADHNAYHMKGVCLPSSSPYDASPVDRSQTSAIVGVGGGMQNDPLLGGPINAVDNRQVRFLASWNQNCFLPSIFFLGSENCLNYVHIEFQK